MIYGGKVLLLIYLEFILDLFPFPPPSSFNPDLFPNFKAVNNKVSALYARTKMGVEADKSFDKLIAETPIRKFKLQNLDEIKNVVKNFDI